MDEEDIFEKLARELNTLPVEIQEAYESATEDEIRVAGNTLRKNLIRGAGKDTIFSSTLVQNLNNSIQENETFVKGEYYEVDIDWNDDKIVNTDLGLGYGKYKNVPRAKGKRNYSLSPATYKDLAYIINYGRGANFSQKASKVIAGNYFIQKATRSVKKWKAKRDITFKAKLDLLAKKKFD